MADHEHEQSGGPGIPGFARRFAASSRTTGASETAKPLPRLAFICGLVLVVVAGAVGVGYLTTFKGSSGQRDVADIASSPPAATASPGPARTSSVPTGSSGAGSSGGRGYSSSGAGSVEVGSQTIEPKVKTPARGDKAAGATPKKTASTSGSSTGSSQQSRQKKAAAPPTWPVVSYASGSRCIDPVRGQVTVGQQLQIYDCKGYAWEQWSFPSDSTIRTGGLCMQVGGDAHSSGSPVVLADCNGGAAQRFTLNAAHDLVNIAADRCVDLKDKQTDNGTRLQLWSCKGTSNQKWHRG